jgi:hypothetical protein
LDYSIDLGTDSALISIDLAADNSLITYCEFEVFSPLLIHGSAQLRSCIDVAVMWSSVTAVSGIQV